MAITTQGYDGVAHEIDEVGWAHISDSYGSAYSVAGLDGAPDENAGRVTTVSSADRTVAVAPLIAYGHGVRDRSDSTVNVQLPSVTAGLARWFLVALRRDWQANTSTIAALPDAQTSAVIPPQRETTRGVKDDQPLALVQITGGQSIPTQVIDLRCWSGNGGVVAATTNALAYLSALGSRVTVGETVWTRGLNAQGTPVWTVPTREDSGWVACTSANGFNAAGLFVRLVDGVIHTRGSIIPTAPRTLTTDYELAAYLPSIARLGPNLSHWPGTCTRTGSNVNFEIRPGAGQILVRQSGPDITVDTNTNFVPVGWLGLP